MGYTDNDMIDDILNDFETESNINFCIYGSIGEYREEQDNDIEKNSLFDKYDD